MDMLARLDEFAKDLSWMNRNLTGLPDSWVTRAGGNVSEPEYVLERLHMNRSMRRQAKLRKIHLALLNRGGRSYIFREACSRYLDNGQNVLLEGENAPSWEAVVFEKFKPGWLLDPLESSNECAENALPGGLEGKDVPESPPAGVHFSEWWEADNQDFLNKHSKAISSSKSLPRLAKRGELFPRLYCLVVRVYITALDKFVRWDALIEEEQAQLVDVFYGMFTLLGVEAIKPVLEARPSILLNYFKSLLKANAGLSFLDDSDSKVEDGNDDCVTAPVRQVSELESGQTDQPTTLQDFYANLLQLAEAGARTPHDIAHADMVMAFVVDNLPRLRSSLQIDQATLAEKLQMFAHQVVILGKELGISLFEDQMFIVAFTKAWIHSLYLAVQTPVTPEYLHGRLLEIEEAAMVHARLLQTCRIVQGNAEVELKEAEAAKARANFTTRREAAATVTQAESALREAEQNLIDVEEIATSVLLPDNITLNDLSDYMEEGKDTSLEPAKVHPESVPALLSFDATSASATTEIVAEASETEVEVVAVTPTPEVEPMHYLETPLDENGPAAAIAQIEVVTTQAEPAAATAVVEEEETTPEAVEEVAVVVEVPSLAPERPIEEDEAPPQENENILAGQGEPALQPASSQIVEDTDDLVAHVQDITAKHGVLPAILVDSAIVHWLAKSELPNALATWDLANQQDVTVQGTVIERDVLQSAYTGLHVWPNQDASLGKIRSLLNFIPPQRIDEMLLRRQTKAIVPGLLFSASFQAAIFAGNSTAAPRILAACEDMVDPQLQRLIREVVASSNRNIHFDIDALRMVTPAEAEEVRIRELQSQLDDVVDRVRSKQVGWAPARKALSACFDLPDFKEAIEAVRDADWGKLYAVEHFLDTYESEEARRDLFTQQIRMMDIASNSVIGRTPMNQFHTTIQALRDIFLCWLSLRNNASGRQADIGEAAKRLISSMRNAASYVAEKRAHVVGVAQKANYGLFHAVLTQVLAVVDGQSGTVAEPAVIKAVQELPYAILLLTKPATESLSNLSSITTWLSHPLNKNTLFDLAMAAQDSVTAQVLLRTFPHLAGRDIRRTAVQALEAQTRKDLVKKLQLAEILLDNALLAEIFDDEEEPTTKQQLLDALKEEIEVRTVYERLSDIRAEVEAIEREIEAKLGRRVEDDEVKLRSLIDKAVDLLGEEAVPADWRQRAEQALQSRMLPLVTEMISQLEHSIDKREKLPDIALVRNIDLEGFVEAQGTIYQALRAHPNPRETWRSLVNLLSKGLDFSRSRVKTKEVIETLSSWYLDRKLNLDNPAIANVREILSFLGMQVVPRIPPSGIRNEGPFRALTIKVFRGNTGRGFPYFDGEAGNGTEHNDVRVFIGVGDWLTKDLIECVEREAYGKRDILISPKVMDASMREELAVLTKQRNLAIYHIDPVMAAYLGMNNVAEDKVLKTWLQMTAPWTGFNPYHKGDTLMPAKPEMRYGRLKQSYELTRPHSNAVVYGGRQLGKTTILHEAVRLVQKNSDVAAYTRVDQTMVGPVDEAWENCRSWLFNEIHQLLYKAGFLPSSETLPNADDEEITIRQALNNPGNSKRVLLCLDEVDPLLELDSKKDFKLFRAIVNFVQTPNSPLKVVIAGLQNVKRFEQVPNVPLNQLGDSMQVSILETQDAIDLVQEPLAIAGYYFADPMLINQVLVVTNRHPGLIQVYCAKLLEHLHKDSRLKIGDAKITSSHLEWVSQDEDVQDRIQSRFEYTLNVDRRYGVIVYGLIAEGVLNGERSVTASRVLGVARKWAPQWFSTTSEGNIEAFLDEMIGLGILKSLDGRKYSLRNPSILRLIGDRNKATDKLLRLVDSPAEDPLSAHRKCEDKGYPSPLTRRDEQLLLKHLDPKGREKTFSVTAIVGSPALGLTSQFMRPALETLGMSDGSTTRLDVHVYKDSVLKRVGTLKEKLLESLAKRQSRPSIFMIEISGQMGLSHTLALIDAAHLARVEAPRVNHGVMVAFLLGPEALWQWRMNPAITSGLGGQINWIELGQWSYTALVHELERIGLANTDKAVEHLQALSDGWYSSIVSLIDAKNKTSNVDAAVIQDIKGYQGITRVTQTKVLNEFLSNAGVNIVDAPWIKPMLQSFGQAEFDIEDAGCFMLDHAEGFEDEVIQRAVIEWMVSLGLVQSSVSTQQGSEGIPARVLVRYRVSSATANALHYTAQKV